MKKRLVIPLLLCLAAVLCSCEADEFNPDKYVGDGVLAVFGVLVDQNQIYYNDVFVLGHLEIDESKTVEKDGRTYALVTDKKYTSYEELKSRMLATYTEDCVNDILENYDIYRDIDGKLYYDLSDKDNVRKGYKWERVREQAPEFEGKTEKSYTMEYKFVCGKKDELTEFTFLRVNQGYRLTKLQYVD